MEVFIALLRGINVGGTGLLPMKDLLAICSVLGFKSARTYIQSGNVIFGSKLSEAAVRSTLENALEAKMGKRIDVMIRTPEEMRLILQRNPFSDRDPAKVAVMFMGQPPQKGLLEDVIGPAGELIEPGHREIYVYYPEGMGKSKLKLPLKAIAVTVRNMNTVAKLVALTEA